MLLRQPWLHNLFLLFIMEIGLERGFRPALGDIRILRLAAVFFTFSLGTKVHYYGHLHSGAKNRASARRFCGPTAS